MEPTLFVPRPQRRGKNCLPNIDKRKPCRRRAALAEAIRLYEQIVARAPDVFGVGTKDAANMINN
jgi:hypothetical protein